MPAWAGAAGVGRGRGGVAHGLLAAACLVCLTGLATSSFNASKNPPALPDFIRAVPLEEADHLPGLGRIRGSRTLSFLARRPIYQYQQVPYAEPPTGWRRFRPPEPAKPWVGELNATSFGRYCPQDWEPFEYKDGLTYSGDPEDCLTLNVYTPQRPSKCGRLLPVMFYIHGGSWRVGSAHDFRPNYLLEKDVVLVVIQYRLGPLGFLSLQSESIPGNVGLLDQLLALKWVNKHIHKFCGDPENVTILGQSSGAASVTLFMISPLVEKHLFQRVIFQSGSARCSWLLDYKPVQSGRSIADYANCSSEDLDKLAACLRAVPVQELLRAHSIFYDLVTGGRVTGTGGNHAVIQEAGDQRFLVEDPHVSLRAGRHKRVPVMGGVTRNEGSFYFGNVFDFFLQPDQKFNDADFLRHNMTKIALEFSGMEDTTGAISDVYREKYFKESELGNMTLMTPGLIDICGVVLLKACTFRMVQEQSRLAPSYLYTFNYFGRHTKFGYWYPMDYPFSGGVAHSDDLLYLFPERILNSEETEVVRTMVDLWTNFATFGNPAPAHNVPEWPAVSTELGPYLRIDKQPQVLPDFLQEYTATIREGLSSHAAAPRPRVSLLATVSALIVLMIHTSCLALWQ